MVEARLPPIAIDDKDEELDIEQGKLSTPSSERFHELPAHLNEVAGEPAKNESPPSTEPLVDVPPNGGYGWVCVAAAFFINAHTWGMNSVSDIRSQSNSSDMLTSHTASSWPTISRTTISLELLVLNTPSLLVFPLGKLL